MHAKTKAIAATVLTAALLIPSTALAVPESLIENVYETKTEATNVSRELQEALQEISMNDARIAVLQDRIAVAEEDTSFRGAVDALFSSEESLLDSLSTGIDRLSMRRDNLEDMRELLAELTEQEVFLTEQAANLSVENSEAASMCEEAEEELGTALVEEATEKKRQAALVRQQKIEKYGVFPIAGSNNYINSWGFARSGGRRHKGADIMSSYGTPLVAVTSGTIQYKYNRLGGKAVWLYGDNGVHYYYAHMQAVTRSSGRVEAGETIGTVGDTGNARGNPHLHFEMHPGGGAAQNPYDTLNNMAR